MVAYGVTTVIDLRSESEVASSIGPLALSSLPPVKGEGWGEGLKAVPLPQFRGEGWGEGLRVDRPMYIHIPLIDDATMIKLSEASNMFDRYLMMLEHRQAAFGEVFRTLAQAEGTVVFHCFAGKDRTGMVAAMSLALAGVEVDSIAADYAETDTQMAARYEEWLASASPDKWQEMRDDLRCPPERIVGVLDHLEQRWGGVEEYLGAAGMPATDITRLKSKLVS
jgi:protein-tyrosine phosphatase